MRPNGSDKGYKDGKMEAMQTVRYQVDGELMGVHVFGWCLGSRQRWQRRTMAIIVTRWSASYLPR